mmetsp:Transcript_18889/g.60325  ORF Transcript_18889/g.60325 Transcript_18889/m.60325 type:complete len:226 (+) Transcript_18889:870-1547(+)
MALAHARCRTPARWMPSLATAPRPRSSNSPLERPTPWPSPAAATYLPGVATRWASWGSAVTSRSRGRRSWSSFRTTSSCRMFRPRARTRWRLQHHDEAWRPPRSRTWTGTRPYTLGASGLEAGARRPAQGSTPKTSGTGHNKSSSSGPRRRAVRLTQLAPLLATRMPSSFLRWTLLLMLLLPPPTLLPTRHEASPSSSLAKTGCSRSVQRAAYRAFTPSSKSTPK